MTVAPGRSPGSAPRGLPHWRRNLAIAALAVAAAAATAVAALRPFPQGAAPSPQPGGQPRIYSFALIAGKGGTLTFNGTSPGPTLAVPLNATVRVTITNDPTSGITHSFKVVAWEGGAASPPAFPGANTTRPEVGLSPGASETITFKADRVGTFRYLCGVDGHAEAGMWGRFIVVGG